MNTPLLTDSKVSSGLIRVNSLNNDLSKHVVKGLDAHDSEGVVSYFFTDSGGNSLSPLSLILGGFQGGVSQKVYVPLAQNPSPIPGTAQLEVNIYQSYTEVGNDISLSGLLGTYAITELLTGSTYSWKWEPLGYKVFGAEITATIVAEASQVYEFSMTSSNGSFLFVDGAPVILSGGEHGPTTATGSIYLVEGSHDVRIVNWQNGSNGSGIDFVLPSGLVYEVLPSTDSYTTASIVFTFNGILFTNYDELLAGIIDILADIDSSTLTADEKTAITTQLRILPYADTDSNYTVTVNSVAYTFKVTVVTSVGSITVVYNP